MTLWVAVLIACAVAFVTKLAGHVVPEVWLSGRRTRRITVMLPVALLASLVVVQTLGGPGGSIVVDARAVAVVVAAIALVLRAPFIAVVALGAITAAVLRALGWS
jgi:uncharacterized membrane protein